MKEAPPITDALLDYLEDQCSFRQAIPHMTEIIELGRLQGAISLLDHLRFVKAQQEKEGPTVVS